MSRRPPIQSALLTTVVASLIATATGCAIGSTNPMPAGPAASGIPERDTEARSARLYFASPYGVRAVSRRTDRPLGPQQALYLLLKGPNLAEHQRGLTTQVPPMRQLTTEATPGIVDVFLPKDVNIDDLNVTAVSQIACTAAHAEVPGNQPPTHVQIRIHENTDRSQTPWAVSCGSDGHAKPVIGTPSWIPPSSPGGESEAPAEQS